VIAHRLSTIRRADRILVLENGRITQQGTHGELIRSGGLYAELLELQTSGYDGTPAAQ
jgi:ABC-type multidrug transport system fused ATPase/permease subunit